MVSLGIFLFRYCGRVVVIYVGFRMLPGHHLCLVSKTGNLTCVHLRICPRQYLVAHFLSAVATKEISQPALTECETSGRSRNGFQSSVMYTQMWPRNTLPVFCFLLMFLHYFLSLPLCDSSLLCCVFAHFCFRILLISDLWLCAQIATQCCISVNYIVVDRYSSHFLFSLRSFSTCHADQSLYKVMALISMNAAFALLQLSIICVWHRLLHLCCWFRLSIFCMLFIVCFVVWMLRAIAAVSKGAILSGLFDIQNVHMIQQWTPICT